MKDILKAQMYQMGRRKLRFFILVIVTAAFTVFSLSHDVINGALLSDAVCSLTKIISMFIPMFIVAGTGDICTDDLSDNTAYTEILSGHTRLEVFLGRVIPAVIFSVSGAALICSVPVIIGYQIYDSCCSMAVGDIIFRGILLLFPVLRMACFSVLVSFITRNRIIILVLSMFMALNARPSLTLSTTTMAKIFDFKAWATHGLDFSQNMIYDMSMTAGDVFGIVAVSLIMSALYLFIGYYYFSKDDLT